MNAPNPDLEEILAAMGTAGDRIAAMDASEASAGNISVFMAWNPEVRRRFPLAEEIVLPLPAPALAGKTLLVTGSGRRLRDIQRDPEANMGAVLVHADGLTATLHTSPRRLFKHLTSEFNSHLAVHQDQVASRGLDFHAVVHAQPPHLTMLSHIPSYRSDGVFNAKIMRWEPESIVALPQGIGVLDFMVPGSEELMSNNVASLRKHMIVLWSKHGVMARSDVSVTNAVDKIEYAETGAKYEFMNLSIGGLGEGLRLEELVAVKDAFEVQTELI